MKVLRWLVFLALFTTSLCGQPAPAPAPAPAAASSTTPTPGDIAARLEEIRQLSTGLKLQSGNVTLQNGLAKVTLPQDFCFLNPADSETLLTKIWRNPPGELPLGMIIPANFNPLADHEWVVVLRYIDDGYVKDDDAASIDYTKLLEDMKQSTLDANKDRVAQGYKTMELLGWAAPPHYDATTHKLYWAKEYKVGNLDEHTLNYNIRILGRGGVLELNAIAGMEDLKAVQDATPKILSMVDFQQGNRYADFNSSTDKVAEYGIAALVAGGIAAKVGLFKGLWVALLAAKKLIVVAAAAVAAFFKKMWNRMTGRSGDRDKTS